MKTVIFLENEDVSVHQGEDRKIIYQNKKNPDNSSIHDYSLNFENNKEFYKPYWLQEWSEKTKIQGEKTIKDLMTYKGQTLWYFFEYIIYADIRPTLPFSPTSRVIYFIDVINEVLKKEKPEKVVVQNKKNLFYQLVVEICTKKKIRIKSLGLHTNQHWKEKLLESPFLVGTYMSNRIKLRQNLFKTIKKKKINTDLLLLSNERFCNEDNTKNLFWGNIVKNLNKKKIDYHVLEFDILSDIKSLIKMYARAKKNYPRTLYLGSYYNKEVFRQIKEITSLCKKTWRNLKKNNKFKSSLTYKGVNIYPYIEQRLEFCFNAMSPFIADCIAVTESVLKEVKPKMIALDHEMNFYGLGFLIHSKKEEFKTIALQFESVNKRGCVHKYRKSNKILDKQSHVWRPLPDVKCVSGEYARNILTTECNYPDSIIRITGQPRYDNLTAKGRYNKKQIYKKYSLDENKKTILYATKFREDEEPVWGELKRVVKKRGDTQIIFKVAPINDLTYYRKKIKRGKDVHIEKDMDVFELLAIADVFITVRSTVAMEAMCLEKPVLLVDFYKTSTFPYIDLGAAYDAKCLKNLEKSIDICFNDKRVVKKLIQGQKKFLKDYLYKQDGKSGERVVEEIRKLL